MLKTFFGFQEVDASEKSKLVANVFSSVANKYDIMNDVMSLGIHRLWKRRFCSLIPAHANSIIDVAAGTADIAVGALKANDKRRVTICDINFDMLSAGREKAINSGVIRGLEYTVCDAENLPFEDNSFDCYTIAFGIRNVTNINNALKESYRVLKKGGKFMCLEFSKVESEILRKFYDFYSFNMIPKFGKIIANDEGAYKYLAESIKQFPDQEQFVGMIKEVGYKNTNYENLTGGVVAIHTAYKI
ncbi:MAG: bifunctional demethylmenaquinone methyltransferase/2-methoxy-6-polyprenyl-1,4-benzoquinol methylase UbiE [Rickettsiaceae bacterium]|nr:bifunctional demethylmenaquinone methyltransferase/2-methoxy-6-polyprenyl-1,4-benzoquinol methylase UbiE [Rickettsiaceae bacterium]